MIPMTPQQALMLRLYEATMLALYGTTGWIAFNVCFTEFLYLNYGKKA